MAKLVIIIIASLSFAIGVTSLEYGAACATGNVCPNSDDPLQCKGSGATAKCGCATGTFRHPTMKRCVAPAGAACTIRKDDGSAPITCTENANCWQTGTDLRCRCDAGAFYHQDSGECRMGHEGTTCNADVKCDFKQLLVCRDNKCVCPYENMFINPIEANARCRSLFGGFCVAGANNTHPAVECAVGQLRCVSNKCTCNENFFEDTDGICRKGGNATCANNEECHSQFVCTASKCACPGDKVWNDALKTCGSRIGSQCNASSERSECIARAACNATTSQCECTKGYATPTNKTDSCAPLLGSACNTNTDKCHADSNLVCTKNVCACSVNFEADRDTLKCRGKFDQACKVDENCKVGMICENSKCACPAGFVNNEDKCQGTFGQICTANDQCSEQKHALMCSDGQCNCRDAESQINEGDKCVSLVDRQCGVVDGITLGCTANATCTESKCKCQKGMAPDGGRCVNGAGFFTGSFALVALLAALMMSKF